MTGLSVRQPWASMIARGEKTIEVRSWSTRHRGPLLICAAAKPYRDEPTGVALAVVDVVDCRQFLAGDEAAACCGGEAGDFAWVLASVRTIEPVPVKGALGLFAVDVPIVARDPLPAAASLFAGLTF